MAYMNWNDTFSVGVEEIDSQHKQLINMVNEFYDNLNHEREALGKLLNSLVDYAGYHFSTEEKYMHKFNYPDTYIHEKEHEMFIKRAIDVKKLYEEGKLVISLEITNFIKEWIVNHVLGTDKKYSKCFVDNGLR